MTLGDYGNGYWMSGQWYPWATGGTVAWPGTVTWTTPTTRAEPAEPMPQGWKCGDCGAVLAPWKAEHRCPDTGQPAMIYKDTSDDPGTGPAE